MNLIFVASVVILILQDVIGVATMAGMLIKKQNEYIRILGQLGLFSYTFLRSFINKGSGVSLKKLSGIPYNTVYWKTFLFLLGQEHIINMWPRPQLCIQHCISAAVHLKHILTCWDTWQLNKMLWLYFLTLVMSSQTLMMALPLRIADLPKKPPPGPSAADQEFAEVLCIFGRNFGIRSL